MKSRSANQGLNLRSDVIHFGKYKGNSVEWILTNDPDYIIWLSDESICIIGKEILNDAEKFAEEKRYDEAMDAGQPGMGRMDWGLDYGRDD